MHPPFGREQPREAPGSTHNINLKFYGQPSSKINNSKNGISPEEKDTKRKYWEKKWKFGKQKTAEKDGTHTFLIHTDCVSDFGTISPGLVNKSFKYAETWLYGTVGVRSVPVQRPSLFVYPGMVAPNPRFNNQYAGLPRFVPAQLCHCPDVRQGSLCRRCNSRRESTRVRLKERPSLLKATCQEEPKNIADAPDPYNLMRKSRMSVGEATETTSIINPKSNQKRVSPNRNISSNFETFKPKTAKIVHDTLLQSWESDDSSEEMASRKSILECHLNPYELIKKDDSSDDVSDHTAEINSKLKILRPKLKTDTKIKEIKIPEPKKLDKIYLNGQRFRIFDNNLNAAKHPVEEYVSDTETCPKRPPRRRKPGKSRADSENFLLNKNKSSSSPNLSIKSILKKPADEDGDGDDDFGKVTELIGMTVDVRSKKFMQSTLKKKKKKQVQFQVKGSSESIQNKDDYDETPLPENKCDNNVSNEDISAKVDECPAILRRSYSDRRPTTAVVKYKDEIIQMSTSPPNSYLFNDTMALRTRTSRHDSREIFLEDADGHNHHFRVNGKSRPKEPPPPPPPKDESSMSTKDEPLKLCDVCENGLKKIQDLGKTVVTITNSKPTIVVNGMIKNEPSEPSLIKLAKDNVNRVTISVKNEEETPSTCTIIETGSSSTVIPIVSTDNKTTLVVGTTIPQAEPPKPSQYLFSSINLLDDLDPVEAVKRNLVPHFCGKEGSPPRDLVKSSSSLKQISKIFAGPSEPQSLLSTYQSKKIDYWKGSEDSSSITSRSNSFCESNRGSSRTTSRSSSFCSNDYSSTTRSHKLRVLSDSIIPQERDKLEDEYIVRNHKKDEENIYETIKEPIYDQVGLKLNKEEESDDDVPPPLPKSLPPSLEDLENRASKSIFEGASKYDILSYLVDAKDRVQEDAYFVDHRRMESLDGSELSSKSIGSDSGIDMGQNGSDSSEDRDSLQIVNRKGSVEIERNDSGVGSETSQSSRSRWQSNSNAGQVLREDAQHLCEDCDQIVETQCTDSGVIYAPLVCRKCTKKRMERKEIIQEIVETEEKYGRDLKIILDEFFKPMLVAGLLTPEQLSLIFLNTEELLENSESLYEKLRDALDIALDQGDEDLLTMNVGRIFLETNQMLHGFESYCTRQASAAILLTNLEKEKELLRIFLRVSQMENAVLRRMNLNSFLMVPVQRVTKYPLLLARLYKVTPSQHESRELLKEAQHNIELHLEHMNAEAKDVGSTKVWRRFSSSTPVRKTTSELEMTNIKLRKMAVDLLEWNHEEVRFVLEGRMLFTQPTDGNWKRARTLKLHPIYLLLVTLGKPNTKYKADNFSGELSFPTKTGVRESTLLLIKEKCGRYTLIREPLYLDKLIICCESDCDEYLEVQELSSKETFIFKAEDSERTKEWYRQLQYHAQILGGWRKRRNALANIMITGHTYAG